MILKKLIATGFKSFADKTAFAFEPGITCIVGPNGCGKSNVVDAIKWVLGAQSAKSLRGKQMMDVIFNGSGTRKTAGMAQVDLVFDNSDGLLPADEQEVIVSRRLYRTGESEYLLNKQTCRLKDVRELFLDTGIGVDAYSVIEQGKVDVLLHANPQDRRQIFEEAAGISKYKVRKKEAERRLERVNQNLLRVQDVVDEMEKRLRSVKLAAGKARNYQAYSQRLRELRSRYALSEYHRLRVRQGELERVTSELHDAATRLRTALSDNEARTSQANVRIVDLDREISETERRLLTAQSQISAHEERIAASEHRIADQQELLDRSRERLAGFDARMQSIDTRLDEQKAAAEGIESDLSGAHESLSGLQERDRQLAHDLNAARVRLEDEKDGIIDLMRRTASIKNEIQGLGIQQENMSKQKAQLDERDSLIGRQLSEAVERQAALERRRSEIDRLVADQNAKLDQTREKATRVEEDRDSLGDQLAASKEYRSGLESRRQLLEEMDRKHEGVLAGAREILERKAADESGQAFGYVLGVVGELFEADVAHASIVEAVLGHHEKFLVVSRRDEMLADREAFADLSGRVLAFCLDATPAPIGGPDLSQQEGYIARLLDWVRYPAACEKLARHLLGRTHVVESIDAARQMAAMDTGGARFVTMDGLVWEPDGRLAVGMLGGGTGLISRRSELREVERELGEVATRISGLSAEIEQRNHEAGHLERVLHELRGAIHTANTERVETQAKLTNVDDTVRRLSEERPLIASEVEVLARRLTETEEKSGENKTALADLETRSSASERAAEQLEARIEQMASSRGGLAEEITAERVRVGELTQRRSAVAETVRELEAARIQLEAEREKANRDVTEAQERIDQSRRQIAEAEETLGRLRAEHAEFQERSAACREERETLRGAIEQNAAEAKALRGELEETESRLHAEQMSLQEIRVRLEDLVARISEELSVDLAAQYETFAPDEEEDWPAVEREINDLREKIERLGNVNMDAINEQSELEERLTFLTSQMEDLRRSERQLAQLIEKLNRESRERFIQTFEAVKTHFAALFKKLFGGGKAEITLMDSEDVLEAGIEVMARPPGKELRSISLLSGGEKTMTALALLLAVFESRPSPFVLLDEVDAALDEANNVRFNHVLQEFVKHSQFIVITHSKRTMSMADAMYGVTMQEAGVSKRVSVRFEDDQKTAVA